MHLHKPRVLCPLRSMHAWNEVGLVPLASEDVYHDDISILVPVCLAQLVTSDYRCESDCRSRGREFDPGQVPYFPGD